MDLQCGAAGIDLDLSGCKNGTPSGLGDSGRGFFNLCKGHWILFRVQVGAGPWIAQRRVDVEHETAVVGFEGLCLAQGESQSWQLGNVQWAIKGKLVSADSAVFDIVKFPDEATNRLYQLLGGLLKSTSARESFFGCRAQLHEINENVAIRDVARSGCKRALGKKRADFIIIYRLTAQQK